MKVFLLRAAHQCMPGIVTRIFATRAAADVLAAVLVNLMLNSEDESIATAYTDDWQMVLDDLLERLELEPDDDEAPFVEIEEHEVIGMSAAVDDTLREHAALQALPKGMVPIAVAANSRPAFVRQAANLILRIEAADESVAEVIGA